MNDVAYVQVTSAAKSEATGCPRCRPPVLCARHTQALTAARRARTGFLLRAA